MTVVESHQRTGVLGLSLDRWQALLIVGVWLFFHSYQGLIHDSRLYTVQALRVLQPAAFENDLFFAYGSQDSFTAFPWFHALFVSALGVAWSGLLLTLVGQAFWLAGAVALLRRAAAGSKLFWGLLALVALPADYGGYVIFQYGEGFITARLYAEALTFWALVLAPRRWALSALLAVVATALHPLYGAVALGVLLLLLVNEDRRWAVLIPLGAAAALGLAAAGIAPFAALFEVMDTEWRAIVEQRNVVCFPLLWRAEDFAGIALDVIVVTLASGTLLKGSRVLLVSILVVGLGGFGASVLGDAFNNLLLIQLQLSRALWLLAAAANFSLGVAAYELVRRETGRAVLTMLSVGFILQLFPYFAVTLTLIGAVFTVRLLSDPSKTPPVVVQALAYVTLVGAGLAYLFSRGLTLVQDLILAAAVDLDWVIALLRQPSQIDGLVAAVFLCLWRGNSLRLGQAFPAIAVGVLALAAAGWNARPLFQRDLEAGRGLDQMRDLVPDEALVFWHGFRAAADKEGELIWFGLDRRSYLSFTQGAGLVFDQRTAVEYARRVRNLASLLPEEYLGRVREAARALSLSSSPRQSDLHAACNSADSLDYVVLGEALETPALSVWTPRSAPVLLDLLGKKPAESLRSASYYLYACEDMR